MGAFCEVEKRDGRERSCGVVQNKQFFSHLLLIFLALGQRVFFLCSCLAFSFFSGSVLHPHSPLHCDAKAEDDIRGRLEGGRTDVKKEKLARQKDNWARRGDSRMIRRQPCDKKITESSEK